MWCNIENQKNIALNDIVNGDKNKKHQALS